MEVGGSGNPGAEVEIELAPPYDSIFDLYGDVERNLATVLDLHAAQGIRTTCAEGCDACCHQLVMTTMAEARAGAQALSAMPGDRRRDLEGRLEAWMEATADLRRRLQAGASGDLEVLVEGIAAEYWERRIACPFLVEHRCAVYEARPLVCRHHFSVSDPALCESGAEGIDRLEALEEAFFAAQEAIADHEAEIGFFPELVHLALGGTTAGQGQDQERVGETVVPSVLRPEDRGRRLNVKTTI